MASPTPLTAERTATRTPLTRLMVTFAVPVPVAVVLAFLPQLQQVGEVSYWPWEQYGFLGWWPWPRPSGHPAPRVPGAAVWLLSALAVLTTLALFVNP